MFYFEQVMLSSVQKDCSPTIHTACLYINVRPDVKLGRYEGLADSLKHAPIRKNCDLKETASPYMY